MNELSHVYHRIPIYPASTVMCTLLHRRHYVSLVFMFLRSIIDERVFVYTISFKLLVFSYTLYLYHSKVYIRCLIPDII
jgi:hypothetical protein